MYYTMIYDSMIIILILILWIHYTHTSTSAASNTNNQYYQLYTTAERIEEKKYPEKLNFVMAGKSSDTIFLKIFSYLILYYNTMMRDT